MKYDVIDINSELYPEKLRIIKKAPKKIYALGNLNLLKIDSFAIVGTRDITNYGKKYAQIFSKEFAIRDIPIISGLALGTDTEAHKTAVKYNSPTIAVLGTGLDNIYPIENKELFYEIIENNGLVLTESEPDMKYKSDGFSQRNRIISTLSEGVLAIEAAHRSGTSITIKYAKEQNKLFFAIPGRIDDIYSVGTNRMIKEGAKIVTEINDIFNFYPQFMNKKRKTISSKKIKSEYKDIYELLKNKECNIEEISKNIKSKSIVEINKLLTMMELEDLIIKDIGKGYKIKIENA